MREKYVSDSQKFYNGGKYFIFKKPTLSTSDILVYRLNSKFSSQKTGRYVFLVAFIDTLNVHLLFSHSVFLHNGFV